MYLEPGLRDSAAAGQHNFIGRMAQVLQSSGYNVEYCTESDADQFVQTGQSEYSLFHMRAPFSQRSLTFRRVYYYPFWAIEQSEKRWEWDVARTAFDPAAVRRKPADQFYSYWQKRLFGDAPANVRRKGFVYVPLQGRLCDHRSFQSCAPLEMIERVLEFDPDRYIVATLHPKEVYSSREVQKLEGLTRHYPRLTVETGQMDRWLAACDYVVTENSSAAFAGFFFQKPAVLFAKIDFAHIAADAATMGADAAIRSVMDLRPDYAGYIHWFLQQMSINAGRPEADARIAERFRKAGWPSG